MKRLAIVAAIIVPVMAAAGLWLLPSKSSTSKIASLPVAVVLPLPVALCDVPRDTPVVMWVAQAKARFEPCGCVAGMFGGLMRRAVLTSRLPRERVLSCELGGWSGGHQPYELLRSRFYLRGLAAAGVDVVAVGTAEIALGSTSLGTLRAEAKLLGLPLVCANLDGYDPHVVITAGLRRCLITAVVDRDAAGNGLTLHDPVESVTTQAVEAVRLGLDLVILADLDPDACKALARAVPQAALIIGGRTDHPSPEPVAVGSVRVLWSGNHGKVLGSWAWGQPAAAFELLHDKLPEDAGQRAILGDYQKALGEAGFDGTGNSGLRTLGSASLVGTAICATCHQNAHRIHQDSGHHHALLALERKGYQFDPDCLRCHVTGLGEGGYTRGSTTFAEVGCEACHGPGSFHTAAARSGRPLDGTMPQLSASTCVACHDADNSPQFDYGVYWLRILHGN